MQTRGFRMSKTSKGTPGPRPKRFQARLERLRSALNWIVVHIPFDASEVWGLRGQIKVVGEINGFPLRTSLFPTREGRHFLLINKKMQKGARAAEGSVARFQIDIDLEKRIPTIPKELKPILSQDRSLRRWYDTLNPSTRNDIAKWVTDPKTTDARTRRAEQIAERLLNVQDAERDLPPLCSGRSCGTRSLVKAGRRCLSRAGEGICSVFFTTELPMPKLGESIR
jgi:hypothetical protein